MLCGFFLPTDDSMMEAFPAGSPYCIRQVAASEMPSWTASEMPSWQSIQIDTSSRFVMGEEAYEKGAPFFSILSDDSIVGLFINAIANSDDGADPYAFMSKSFAGELDINALKNVFGDTGGYKSLIKAGFQSTPKNCRTNSVVVFNKERKVNSIIHLHMINEPDRFGKWKIFGIEREGGVSGGNADK